MSKFFVCLVNENLLLSWANILDWLFAENKFSKENGWDKNKVQRFTNRVKKLPYLGESTYKHDSVKSIRFPSLENKSFKIQMLIGKKDSAARDIVRHIRNGVAHGNCNIRKIKGELYIQICDFNRDGIQSAYIFCPIDYISKIYEIYVEIEKSRPLSIFQKNKSA